METFTVKFKKDYKNFKKGQFLEIPQKAYTGQIRLKSIWKELKVCLDKDIIKLVK